MKGTMRAAVLHGPGNLRLEREVPIPQPGPNEVLIKVGACGICGSDLRYLAGENPWALHTLGKNLPNPPNMILGHEFAGTVVEAGGAMGENLVGRRVGVLCFQACGTCPECRSGQENLCRDTKHIGHGAGWGQRDYYPGAMADYIAVWATHCYPLPDSISDEEAAVADVLGVAVHAVSISGTAPGARTLVIGMGPVGLGIAQAAKAWGAVRVIGVDVQEGALALAPEHGVDVAVDAREEDVAARVLAETGNLGVNTAFDSVGTADTQRQALGSLASAGTLVNMVANTTAVSFPLSALSSERSIKGSANFLYRDYGLTLDLMAAGKLQATPMITHRFPLEEVEHAFEVARERSRHGSMKVVLLP